jgi:hypothetical protein
LPLSRSQGRHSELCLCSQQSDHGHQHGHGRIDLYRHLRRSRHRRKPRINCQRRNRDDDRLSWLIDLHQGRLNHSRLCGPRTCRCQRHPSGVVRASGNTLDRDDSESVNAFGETFHYNLDRNLESTDFQMELDLGRRGLLSPSDILVFGVLGGFVNGTLITTISRGPSTSRAGRSAATPPILGAGCSSTPLPTCICSTSTPTRPWASPARSMPPRTDSGYRFGSSTASAARPACASPGRP